MKKFAKLIALVLALVLVLSLAACKKSGDASNDNTPTTPVGKWQSELRAEDMMKVAAANGESTDSDSAQAAKKMMGDSTIKVTLELTADNKIIFAPDKESLKALADQMIANLPSMIPELTGMSQEELEQKLQEKGMTMDQLVEALKSQFNVEDMFDEIDDANVTGVYEIEGDKIFLGEEGKSVDKNTYVVFALDGNKLTLKEIVGDAGETVDGMKALLPWEFTRIG